MSLQSYLGTSLVGGLNGTFSSDLLFVNHAGNVILSDTAHSVLNTTHPITQIDISCGWIVDGVSVTYQLAGGGSSTFSHGSTFNPPSAAVNLGSDEIVAAVFGRAGLQTYYARELINNIGFVIFDTVKENVRIAGPFGNGDNSNEGTPFYSSDVLAFGSIADPNTGSALSLSGLFFYEKLGN